LYFSQLSLKAKYSLFYTVFPMSEVISFDQAQTLVLARLRQWLTEVPESERQRPRKVINFKPYSILDLIAEIERNTEVGRSYVMDQAKQLGYVVQ
jgi:hypothetical protein